MKTFWKDPFLHFVLGGVILFIALRSNDTDEANTGDRSREIVITEGRVTQLVEIFRKTWQRPPTGQELQRLIDDFVREEIYYREAIALGLDRNDTIIRRRMKQKIEFLSNDLLDPGDPGDETLAAWYAENEEDYLEGPRYSFRHVYLDPEKHDDFENLMTARIKALSALPADVADDRLAELGDGLSLIPVSFANYDEFRIAREMGASFGKALAELPTGEWTGPVRSGYGFHLVRIDKKTSGRQPELAEVRDAVLRDWNEEKRREGNDQLFESLFHRYTVTFENADGKRQADTPSSPSSDSEDS